MEKRRRLSGNGEQTFGERLEELRIKRGLSIRQMAEQAYISEKKYQRIANNEIRPNAATLDFLSSFLLVDPKNDEERREVIELVLISNHPKRAEVYRLNGHKESLT